MVRMNIRELAFEFSDNSILIGNRMEHTYNKIIEALKNIDHRLQTGVASPKTAGYIRLNDTKYLLLYCPKNESKVHLALYIQKEDRYTTHASEKDFYSMETDYFIPMLQEASFKMKNIEEQERLLGISIDRLKQDLAKERAADTYRHTVYEYESSQNIKKNEPDSKLSERFETVKRISQQLKTESNNIIYNYDDFER